MCTLIALHRCVAGAPLVIAANRDEYHDRPAEGPALRHGGTIAAPLDRQAGGTWLGVNRHGTFVGLTNRPTARPDPVRRSRGLLVMDVLGSAKAWEAAEIVSELPGRTYNPFNLLVADAENAFVCVYEEAPEVQSLEPGVHLVGNADPDDRGVPKVARLLAEAEQAALAPPGEVLEALARVCRGHEAGGVRGTLDDACIHAGPYGTRSSTLLRLGESGTNGQWLHAEGPPCETSYEDRTTLLHELGLTAGGVTGPIHQEVRRI